MLHLNARIVFVCLAALLLVVACADTQKKTTETPSQTAETPSQTAEVAVEEVTLAVTGMT